ncbi:hypothetical protein MVEN_02403700 [Mycena venus]|uniref:Uncharacterized protein n=1 Tax=Mycena venus TaxID=2733690 RepID=A0A8H6X2I6_9AGAR|nr:hypothetical protein MVEN_02403700 [Mycena venus]
MAGDHNSVGETVVVTGGVGGQGGQATGSSEGGRGGDGEGPKIGQLVTHCQITMILVAPSQLQSDVLAALIPPNTFRAVKGRNSTSFWPLLLALGAVCLSFGFLAWISIKHSINTCETRSRFGAHQSLQHKLQRLP